MQGELEEGDLLPIQGKEMMISGPFRVLLTNKIPCVWSLSEWGTGIQLHPVKKLLFIKINKAVAER